MNESNRNLNNFTKIKRYYAVRRDGRTEPIDSRFSDLAKITAHPEAQWLSLGGDGRKKKQEETK